MFNLSLCIAPVEQCFFFLLWLFFFNPILLQFRVQDSYFCHFTKGDYWLTAFSSFCYHRVYAPIFTGFESCECSQARSFSAGNVSIWKQCPPTYGLFQLFNKLCLDSVTRTHKNELFNCKFTKSRHFWRHFLFFSCFEICLFYI